MKWWVIAALVLSGCPASPGRVVTGEAVEAPIGHVLLCSREPNAPECSR